MGALKRLVLCLDGTWNADDGEQITNIVRIRDLINPKLETAHGVECQRVYYHNGVGTGLSTRDKIIGGATGAGLGHNVRSAYRFLSQQYEEGIEIYIFGFSRGAFTARSVAGYIGASGLLRPENCSEENETRAWNFYRTPPDDRQPQDHEALAKLSYPDVKIRLLGVFDTVGALGVPLELFGSWNRRRFQFHNVTLGTNIEYALHALAIDEKRGPFQASLWQYPNHKNFESVEQVWFPGVHSNIGGGYENAGLSDIALHWMLSRIETKKIGLQMVAGWRTKVACDPLATLNESRTPAYVWSRFSPMIRVINQRRLRLAGPARTCGLPRHAIPLGEMVHWSALVRWRKSEEPGASLDLYRPINLEAALNDTFKPPKQNPEPIPIVGASGEALDWIGNENDRKELMTYLPTQYHDACGRIVESFAGTEKDISAFSQSYQQPRQARGPKGGRVSK
jgi:type VI secretion system (T6SS) phospholipase Tle1-like effector